MKRSPHPTAVLRRFATLAAVAIGLASCGTAELEVEATFDDTWTVVELVSGGEAIDLAGQDIEIEIDTGQAAVRGQTRCQPFFGSYTLTNGGERSGEASFTIPSPAASDDCPAADRLVHTGLVDALESVTQWRREGATLTLSSPSGTRLILAGSRGE